MVVNLKIVKFSFLPEIFFLSRTGLQIVTSSYFIRDLLYLTNKF